MVSVRATEHCSGVSRAGDGDPAVSSEQPAHRDVTRLQHAAHRTVHGVRSEDPQDPRELQRSKVHCFHHVLDVHCVARFHTHLLWN